MKKIKLQINKPFKHPETKKILKAGEIIEISTCKNGIPLHKYFRSRLKDARIDSCCEIINEKKGKR